MARNHRPVRTQMPSGGGKGTPSLHGAKGSVEQYPCAPFSAHPHDTGTGGIPVKVYEHHGEKMPTTHAPASTAPVGMHGEPSIRTRRY